MNDGSDRVSAADARALLVDGDQRPGLRDLGGRLVRGKPARVAEEPAGEGAAGGAARVSVLIPLRTGRGQNDREHWAAKARRVKAERQAAHWGMLMTTTRPSGKRLLPCTVMLTRVAPSIGLDGDNLQGSLKACRDGVADWLEVDDRDPRVTWDYGQRRGKRGEWAVEVRVS